MEEVAYILPDYSEDIIDAVCSREWIVHNFNTDSDKEIYNPCNYLYNREFTGTEYTLVLDLNIYQFLVNSTKKTTESKHYQDATAILVFCQLANIEIDPTYPVYEKLNYDSVNLNEALTDLEVFHSINNSKMDELAKYALGYSDSYENYSFHNIDREKMGEDLLRFRRLKGWDSLYLIMLAIIDVKYDSTINADKKLERFLYWLIREFRLSLVSVVYAVVLFGRNPIKRMMKYKPNENYISRRKSVCNMTWDLYIMDQFFKKWTSKDVSYEYMFASDDKAFCKLLRTAIDIQKSGSLSPLSRHLNGNLFERVTNIIEHEIHVIDRAYKNDDWDAEYRGKLISNFECKLFEIPQS